jgi:hypothetical protein
VSPCINGTAGGARNSLESRTSRTPDDLAEFGFESHYLL